MQRKIYAVLLRRNKVCNIEHKTTMRDKLISLDVRTADLYVKHRKEIESMLENQSQSVRRERWISVPIFIFLVLLSVTFFLVAGFTENPSLKVWFACIAIFIAIADTTIVLRYHIIRMRLEMMKEIKELQLGIIELGDRLTKKT